MSNIFAIFEPSGFKARRRIWITLLIALCVWLLSCIIRASVNSADVSWIKTDLMAFSGFLTVLVGIAWSIYISVEPKSLLSRWHNAALINLNSHCRQRIARRLEKLAIRRQLVLALLLVASTIVGFAYKFSVPKECFDLYFFPFSAYGHSCEFYIASIICALLVGLRLGRLISYGFIGGLLKKYNVPMDLTLEHPDHAGGTSQIGMFYLMQAAALLIPALWLLFWTIFSIRSGEYKGWEFYFMWLLSINAVLFGIAFLVPVRRFREMMVKWKQENAADRIDQVRAELLNLRSIDNPTAEERDRRVTLAHDLDVLVHFPNMPVSPITRRLVFTSLITSFVLPVLVSFLFIALKEN